MKKKGYLAFFGLGCVVAACSSSVAPDRFSLFNDIVSLQLAAGLAQQTYSVDSSAKFNFVARNPLPRDVVVYGTGCIITLELQNMQGVTVFPSGARPCLPPLETLRVRARDSVMGGVQMSGALGNPSWIGTVGLPAGTFRMRIVIQGVTDTESYNPVRVQSAWSDPFDVSP
jgi:hypothetical protein